MTVLKILNIQFYMHPEDLIKKGISHPCLHEGEDGDKNKIKNGFIVFVSANRISKKRKEARIRSKNSALQLATTAQ